MTNAISERRRFGRVPVDLAAVLITPSGARLEGRVRDIAYRGLFVECGLPPEAGMECRVQLVLDDHTEIELAGRIARTTPMGAGISFDAEQGNSFDLLREFLIAAADDPESMRLVLEPLGQ